MRHANSSGPLEDLALDCLLVMLAVGRLVQIAAVAAVPFALIRWRL